LIERMLALDRGGKIYRRAFVLAGWLVALILIAGSLRAAA
jgi:hypothetical protein